MNIFLFMIRPFDRFENPHPTLVIAVIVALATGAAGHAALSTTAAIAARADRAASARQADAANETHDPGRRFAERDAERATGATDGPGAPRERGPTAIAGPVAASVIRVVDGDTLLVDAAPWPQQTVRVYVRIRGIDAPELHARCASERLAGLAAKRELAGLLSSRGGPAAGASLALEEISGDKYFGRVVARVRLADHADVAEHMLRTGLARPYDGGRKPQVACNPTRAG